jgi:hypothetical protein
MKIIKWKQFNENISNLTKEQINFLDQYAKYLWKYENGVVNVYGNFDCNDLKLTDFKGIQFGKINGNFDCSENELSDLKGAPKEVVGDFFCSRNKLSNLLGGPSIVGRDYFCNNNELNSLEGSPETVNNIFDCSFNKLLFLTGGPKKTKIYNCSNNILITLEGGPLEVKERFNCNNNQLDSLIDLANSKINIRKLSCHENNLKPLFLIRNEIIKLNLEIKDFNKVAFSMVDQFDDTDIKIVLDNIFTQEINANANQIFIDLVKNSSCATSILDFLKRNDDKKYNLFKDTDLKDMTDMGF